MNLKCQTGSAGDQRGTFDSTEGRDICGTAARLLYSRRSDEREGRALRGPLPSPSASSIKTSLFSSGWKTHHVQHVNTTLADNIVHWVVVRQYTPKKGYVSGSFKSHHHVEKRMEYTTLLLNSEQMYQAVGNSLIDLLIMKVSRNPKTYINWLHISGNNFSTHYVYY